MMQRICSLIVLLFTLNISANAQGTPGTLNCTLRGGLEIHASRDPGSSLIGRVQCGDAVLIIDQRFGSPHIRTEDGKDGYITSQNLGQWSIQPEPKSASSSPPSSTTKVASLGSPASRELATEFLSRISKMPSDTPLQMIERLKLALRATEVDSSFEEASNTKRKLQSELAEKLLGGTNFLSPVRDRHRIVLEALLLAEQWIDFDPRFKL